MLAEWFTLLIYQPFLNLLIFFYWLLDLITGGNPDMGIAVILLTIVIRFLLLPLSFAADRTEEERRSIAARVKEVEEQYQDDPVQLRLRKKHIMRTNRRIVVAEIITLAIQIVIALMLWQMFGSGLMGHDADLIYSFMPHPPTPFNLVFLGRFDLTHTNFFLNLLQSLLIFVLETVIMLNSPYGTNRKEIVRLQLILPVVSFFVFMFLPAGKKLFVITTLIFSIIFTLIKSLIRAFNDYRYRKEAEEAAGNDPTAPDSIVVDVK